MPLFDNLVVRETSTGHVWIKPSTLSLLRVHPMTGEEAEWFGKQMMAAGQRAKATRAQRLLQEQGQLTLSTLGA